MLRMLYKTVVSFRITTHGAADSHSARGPEHFEGPLLMAIKLKAKETLIQVGKYAGTYRYVLSPELYTKLSEQKVIQEAALRSGLTPATIKAAYDSVGLVLAAWATEGLRVPIPGVGSMRFGVKASSVNNVDKVSANLITARKVVFTPSVAIKNELKATSLAIACYDRNNKLVKTVNSKGDDQGDFEVELIASPEGAGTFEGGGFFNDGETTLIKAVPAEGYVFVKWDDDEIEATRSLIVNDNVCHVATFKKVGGSVSGNTPVTPGQEQTVKKTITASPSPSNGGTVTGGGSYAVGEVVTLNASPSAGYAFSKWDDGNTSASRQITVSEDKTYRAIFVSTAIGDEDEGH